MPKVYLKENVYEAALKRLKYIFDEFDNIIIAFSGGKDSGVLLELCDDYITANKIDKNVAIMHIDYECQYQFTTDYVSRTLNRLYDKYEVYHICMPIKANCGCRMDADWWIPWEESKKNLWVRELPKKSVNINNHKFNFWKDGMEDYDFQMHFTEWYKNKKQGKTIVLTGIRAGESYTRYMRSVTKINKYKNKQYILEQVNKTYHGFPLYDWETEDIWIYNAKFNKDYNKLYDLYYQAGLSIDQMRVANPFHSCGLDTLKLYKAIDPNMWGKMVSRVNGVCFAGIYGGTTAMGWKSITLPKGHTWKSYCMFLLSTLEPKVREHYMQKLETSMYVWQEKGCVVSDETIEELNKLGIEYEDLGITKKSKKRTIRFKNYEDDLDVTNFREVPTYKRMCVCILKNDYTCKYMGFSQTKNDLVKRKKCMEKYSKVIKGEI